MRVGESMASHDNSRRKVGLKLLGVAIAVALVVAVSMSVGENAKEAKRDLFVSASVRMRHAEAERELFESTGIRGKAVVAGDAVRVRGREEALVVGSDTDLGTFGLLCGGRYLSSHNGNGKKLILENAIAGDDDRWTIDYEAGVFRFEKYGASSYCIKMEGDDDVRLKKDCNDKGSKFILMRVDTGTNVINTYNQDKFLIYGYANNKKFITCENNNVDSKSNPQFDGYFSLEDPQLSLALAARSRRAEAEIFRATGRRAKVVDADEFSRLFGAGKLTETGVKGETTYHQCLSIKCNGANRYLSRLNGLNAKLVGENGVGATEKWKMWIVNGNFRIKRYDDASETECIFMEGDGDVRLKADCLADNSQLVVARVEGTNPNSGWSGNDFVIYRFTNAKKFIVMSSGGSVSAASDPVGNNGYFSFATC